MATLLVLAAVLTLVLGLAHSVLGEKYILVRLFRRTDLPRLFGSPEFTVRTLRFAWHITTVAWIGAAALLFHAGRGGLDVRGMLQVIGATFVASGLLPLWFTRGRHLSWLVLFAIGGIALWCAPSFAARPDAAAEDAVVEVVDTRSCEARKLALAVSAYGAPEDWKAIDALPDALKDQVGERLNDTGHVADGYAHDLVVDRTSGLGYVVQTGGFAGTRKVFGPFAIDGCAAGGQAES
jgi:hypothetical protein